MGFNSGYRRGACLDTDTILKSFLCSVRRAGVLDESDDLRTSDGSFGSKIYQAIIDILVYISDHRRTLHSLLRDVRSYSVYFRSSTPCQEEG